MKRRELRNLPVDPFPTPEVEIEAAEYYLTAKVHEINDQKVLTTTFHRTSTRETEFRVFSTGEDFITQMLDSGKWSSSMVEKLLPYDPRRVVTLDKHSNQAGPNYYGFGKSTLDALRTFQTELRNSQLRIRQQEYRKNIDDIMSGVRTIPKRFSGWINDMPLKHSRYIFYKRHTPKYATGFCSNCTTEVEVDKPVHNEPGQCPNCRSEITFKARGKSNNVMDNTLVCLIQKGKGTLTESIVARWFNVTRTFPDSKEDRVPITQLQESWRLIIDSKGDAIFYEWKERYSSLTHQFSSEDWQLSVGRFIPNDSTLYTSNLTATLKNTSFQYCKIREYAQRNNKFDVAGFLVAYSSGPSLEYLVMLGLDNLIEDLLMLWVWNQGREWPVNITGSSAKDVLGVDKHYIPLIKKHDVITDELKLIQNASKHGRVVSEESLLWNRRRMNSSSTLAMLAEYMDLERAINYINSGLGFKSPDYAVRDYYDYLRNCSELGYNMRDKSVLFPRDLQTAHDRTANLVTKKRNRNLDPLIAGMAGRLNREYSFSSKELLIRAPAGVDELIDEGAALKHCVGSYIDRIAKGETTVLFVRRTSEPEKPYFTVQVTDDRVNQVRGMANCQATPEVELFISEWKQAVWNQNKKAV